MRRAVSRCSGAMRDTISEMKTTLSMPSTISIAESVIRLAQICGSVSQSKRVMRSENMAEATVRSPLEL